MTKRIRVAVGVVAMIVGGLLGVAGAAPLSPDSLSRILATLDELLMAVGNVSGDGPALANGRK